MFTQASAACCEVLMVELSAILAVDVNERGFDGASEFCQDFDSISCPNLQKFGPDLITFKISTPLALKGMIDPIGIKYLDTDRF
jgi:hypothetical protein